MFPLRSLLLSILLLAGCAVTNPRPAEHRTGPVILVSIDGFRADFLDRGLAPHLSALAASGVRARAMRPAFPTLTFPNHYTLVTGLYPDHHGIIHNRMVDPETGARYVYNDPATTADPHWWGGEPIWVGAERHGIRTATMFWPGSDVAIQGVRPSLWMQYDGKLTPAQRVDALLGWFDAPAAQRPAFATLYFDQVDHAGHDFGPNSPEVAAAAAQIDAAIGRLLDGLAARGLADHADLVVVSDHGSAPTSEERLVFLDRIVDLEQAGLTMPGIVIGFRPAPEHRAEVEAALLAPHDHLQCWRKEHIPARLHYGSNPRVPPLVCAAEAGWMITSRDFDAQKKGHYSRGEHGYDNAAPEMRAMFVAHGPSFRKGLVVPEFDNVDVYPLLTRLLGIPAAKNDGNPATGRAMLTGSD